MAGYYTCGAFIDVFRQLYIPPIFAARGLSPPYCGNTYFFFFFFFFFFLERQLLKMTMANKMATKLTRKDTRGVNLIVSLMVHHTAWL